MFGSVKISPSVLSADFMNVQHSIKAIEEGGADFIHVDVMDGHFVPNLTMGIPYLLQMRKITNLPLDVHLMVDNPSVQVPWYLEAEIDYLTMHIEVFNKGQDEVFKVIESIRSAGAHPALAIKPDTMVDILTPYISYVDMILVMSVYPGFSGQSYIDGTEQRITQVVELAQAAGVSPLIEVDGGIGIETARRVVKAGADVLVAGNSIFGTNNIKTAISKIRSASKGV